MIGTVYMYRQSAAAEERKDPLADVTRVGGNTEDGDKVNGNNTVGNV